MVDIRQYGAVGDGTTNDTAAFVKAAAAGGLIEVPNGIYIINTDTIILNYNTQLQMSPFAVLKIVPSAQTGYYVIRVDGADVTISGGILIGDRSTHLGTAGEWGMGIWVGKTARKLIIQNLTVRDMWGDGIYIGGGSGIAIHNVLSQNNRRQGMSVVAVSGLSVTGSTFQSTEGTPPQAGVDIEPDSAANKITNVQFYNCKFINNKGNGFQIMDGSNSVTDLSVQSCTFTGNKRMLNARCKWFIVLRWLYDIGWYNPTSVYVDKNGNA